MKKYEVCGILTSILTCESDFAKIGDNIKHGSTVVFPTDTVYGLGASPFSRSGINRCFEIKKRLTEKKLPILFSSASEAAKVVKFDARARLIAKEFWPGQLTLILPVRAISLPNELLSDDRTLAVRVPRHECCIRLIRACGNSLIGTSANLSGSPPFVDPNDPGLTEFARRADCFIKGRCGNNRLPSTILDLSRSDRFSILREGAISREKIIDYFAKTRSADFSFRAIKT